MITPKTPTKVVERLRRSENAPQVQHGGPAIGIDLGTTNSCVAFAQNGVARVLTTAGGYETVPSVVFINEARQVLIGHPAVEKMLLQPGRGIYGSKRFMGRPYASTEVEVYGHFFQYELAPGKAGLTAAKIGQVVLPLEIVAGYILWFAKKMAEEHLQKSVERAVITVPAYFGETQRQSVHDAARMAGLHVERIITEPTAAAVAYGYGRNLDSTIFVYDLGGGTFDASVLRIRGDTMEVLATDGDAFLGGCDFDDRLTQHALTHLRKSHGVDLQDNTVALHRLRLACEDAKRQLSSSPSATLHIPYLAEGAHGPIDFNWTLSRTVFEELTHDLMDRTLTIVQQALDRAGVKASDVDDVILAGGQSRSPRIRQLLAERFGKKPSHHVHPDHAVALGAALVAETLSQRRVGLRLIDVLPASIRLVLNDDATTCLLTRGQKLPIKTTFAVRFAGPGGKPLTVALCRGEAPDAKSNQPLGRLRFPDSIVAKAAGSVLHIGLQVSEDGIITVTAEVSTPAGTVQHALTLDLLAGLPQTKVVEGDEMDIVTDVAAKPRA